MRRDLMLLALLATAVLPVSASKSLTVQQFESIVTEAHSSHQSDDALTQQLTSLKLTERLTGDPLQKLVALSPGPKSTQALYAIAGLSTFLSPSAEELPASPTPDFATQKAIMSRTVNYVVHTLPALPNFLATRVTRQFIDNIRGVDLQPEHRGDLYWIGDRHAPISFRDGRESDDPTLAGSHASPKRHGVAIERPLQGMTSWGEFGPFLGMVILDAAKGKLAWQRWETQNGKPVAVFQLSVPRDLSHYQLSYCCEGVVDATTQSSNLEAPTPIAIKPGYRGTIEVDPETGNILRLTIEADLKPDDAISRAFMMVEYGPVKIGEDTRICPIRSVSLSQSQTQYESHGAIARTDRLLLNEVEFTNYHRFGSESTLLIGSANGNSEGPGAAPLEADSAPALATPAEDSAATASSPPAAAPAPLPAPPATSAADAEISIHPATGLPGMDADPTPSAAANKPGEAGFILKATTRLVDLNLIAVDKHGKPLTDLQQNEVEVYDNGRRQQIAAFHHAGTTSPSPTAPPVSPASPTPPAEPGVFTNVAVAAPSDRDAPDLLILLLDESHLALNDLNQARGEVLRFLKAARPDARVALYSISDDGFQVIQDVTQDHALMAAKLAAWSPSASAVAQSQNLDRRAQQQVENLKDAEGLHGPNLVAQADIPAAFPLGDPDLRTLGNNPLRAALEGMTALARHFAPVPGHKSLAWISGDRALSDSWSRVTDEDVRKRSAQQLEPALAHTREALNDAHIALYVVDASRPNLLGGGLDPSRYTPGQETSPAATSNQVPGGDKTPIIGTQSNATIQMDLAGIRGPLRDLAQSTGGRAVDRGDLVKALAGIEDDARALYEVSFDPDTAADNKFHTLLIKIPSRKDVKLRYRTGYEYSEESRSSQQRFQEAVWSPQDPSAIKLTAEASPESTPGSPTIKLRIAFPGLALEHKDSRWTDRLYIFVAVRDDATQQAQVSGDTVDLSLKQASYESGMPSGIPYQRTADIQSKLSSVRVIVVDGNSGKIGSVTLPSSALHP